MNTATPVQRDEKMKAQKEPPKFIEKVIEKVEEVLTKPASQSKKADEQKPPQPQEQQPQKQETQGMQQSEQTPEQAQAQGSVGENNEYILPKGTTIKLPDGKEFETHTESKIKKEEEVNKG